MKKTRANGYLCVECYERGPWFMPRTHVCEVKNSYILERTKKTFLEELAWILKLSIRFR